MGLANGRKKESGNVKLHYSDLEICQIYAEALENETGMPVENLDQVFDYGNYELSYNAQEAKTVIKLSGVYVQFELEDAEIQIVNYADETGWHIDYSNYEEEAHLSFYSQNL
jgi:hypothetical protein|tara:strand:- start:563 stop:898 length:336 start_codon:yes stop_codon:yes gene_type:complete